MRRRTYLAGATAGLAGLAGCGNLGGSDPVAEDTVDTPTHRRDVAPPAKPAPGEGLPRASGEYSPAELHEMASAVFDDEPCPRFDDAAGATRCFVDTGPEVALFVAADPPITYLYAGPEESAESIDVRLYNETLTTVTLGDEDWDLYRRVDEPDHAAGENGATPTATAEGREAWTLVERAPGKDVAVEHGERHAWTFSLGSPASNPASLEGGLGPGTYAFAATVFRPGMSQPFGGAAATPDDEWAGTVTTEERTGAPPDTPVVSRVVELVARFTVTPSLLLARDRDAD